METMVTIFHSILAVFMIMVVLVQGGNSGGVGAAFGGGNSSGVFGASGGTSFFAKLTYGAALLFMLTSVTLTYFSAQATRSSIDMGGLEQRTRLEVKDETTPAAQDPAAAATPTEATKTDASSGESPASDEK